MAVSTEKRFRFMVEYENDMEWGYGCIPGDENGESPESHEVVTLLRNIADQLEKGWRGKSKAPAIVFPPRGEDFV